MSDGSAPAHLPGIDLERELSCSICTDILYQPLTLLDCLHTFCGACLKEWFLSQASRAKSLHPYTCPACRASVRATKHNATVATLLDMFLQANPTKAREEAEKKDINKIYKPGDNVLPKLRRRGRRGEDEEDQRVVNDVLQMSLQDAGISDGVGDGASRSRREHTSRERRPSRGAAARPEGQQMGMYMHTHDEPRSSGRRPRRDDPAVTPARSLDHQSSLRSLLSVSESEVEEEILRQIMEDGLIDGIDVNNLTAAQEDELSERIAAAYRRRQDEQRRLRRAAERASQPTAERSTNRSRDGSRQRSRPRVVAPTLQQQASTSSPIHVRSPDNLTPTQALQSTTSQSNASQNTRTASHHRSSSADNSAPLNIPRQVARPAARSASNLPLSSQIETREIVQPPVLPPVGHTNRRSTEPAGQSSIDGRSSSATDSRNDGELRGPPTRAESDGLSAALPSSRISTSPRANAHTFPIDSSRPRSSHAVGNLVPVASAFELPMSAPANTQALSIAQSAPLTHSEPSISCRRCGTNHIEYDLHYTCFKCDPAGYDLCLSCYRHSEGCLHWFGFGWGAWQKYNRSKAAGVANMEPPHSLTARRYIRPDIVQPKIDTPTDTVATQNPESRLQSGVFCDICYSFASRWYWRCDLCNEGEWGYCSSCVNQGRHCTHPLLSLTCHTSPPTSPTTIQSPNSQHLFTPKSLTTMCDICNYPIPPSNTRYHCLKCNDGDYDVHVNCYTSLVKSGRITINNGHNGWRRCLNGHRMVILGFEDRDGGQRRIVVRDMAGGDALKDDDAASMAIVTVENQDGPQQPSTPPSHQQQHSAGWRWTDTDGTARFLTPSSTSPSPMSSPSAAPPSQLPPDGGVGLRLLAKWGYYPAEPDELMFPKGAEIKEAEDINGDWFWGVYAGRKGLFPGNYGRVVGRS